MAAASSDPAVVRALAAVDAAAAKCTAAAQHLVAVATAEATLKGKGLPVEGVAAGETKVAAGQLADAAREVAQAKKLLAVVTAALAEASFADASSAARLLDDLLVQEGADASKVKAATAAAAEALLAVAAKQAMATSSREAALKAASFAKAAADFANAPTQFYSFAWPCKETVGSYEENCPMPSEEEDSMTSEEGGGSSFWKSQLLDLWQWQSVVPQGRVHLLTAARLIQRDMQRKGYSITVGELMEILQSPHQKITPQIQAILPHLVSIAPQLPIPDQVIPQIQIPSPVQPVVISEVALPAAFHGASEVQPAVEQPQKFNWTASFLGAAVFYMTTLGMDAVKEQLTNYKPDFSQLGTLSTDNTPEPQEAGKIFE